jgi:hypothetical protein
LNLFTLVATFSPCLLNLNLHKVRQGNMTVWISIMDKNFRFLCQTLMLFSLIKYHSFALQIYTRPHGLHTAPWNVRVMISKSPASVITLETVLKCISGNLHRRHVFESTAAPGLWLARNKW